MARSLVSAPRAGGGRPPPPRGGAAAPGAGAGAGGGPPPGPPGGGPAPPGGPPPRGWYVLGDGRDMELNGAMPDEALWNDPLGADRQLEAAVSRLQAEVDAAAARPDPTPIPAATERR